MALVTFEEALAALRGKVSITSAQFEALYEEAKRRAFFVSALEAVDTVERVKGAILEAIEKGLTGEDFRRYVANLFQSPAHIETVFRTNVMAAYGEGRYQQQAEMADIYPYARYRAIGDDRTRPDHMALDGIVSPIGSAFWQAHWPPWSFNCRCSTEPVAADEVDSSTLVKDSKFASDFRSPARGLDTDSLLDRLTPEQRRLAEKLIA